MKKYYKVHGFVLLLLTFFILCSFLLFLYFFVSRQFLFILEWKFILQKMTLVPLQKNVILGCSIWHHIKAKKLKPLWANIYIFFTPENIRKSEVFRCLKGVKKEYWPEMCLSSIKIGDFKHFSKIYCWSSLGLGIKLVTLGGHFKYVRLLWIDEV